MPGSNTVRVRIKSLVLSHRTRHDHPCIRMRLARVFPWSTLSSLTLRLFPSVSPHRRSETSQPFVSDVILLESAQEFPAVTKA